MRAFLKARTVWSRIGRLWPVLLLALPGCRQILGIDEPGLLNLNPGPLPHNSAIFCDIEKMSEPRHCAGGDELLLGISLSHAAVAFTTADSSSIGLDYSPDAVAACGGPQVVTFEGPFPEGYPVCANCLATVGGFHADANAVCVAQCEDLHLDGADHNTPEVVAFCEAHAHVSTNAPVNDCFGGACTPGGILRHDFIDPRRRPEPVLWQDPISVDASYFSEPFGETISTLTRTAVNPPGFTGGAASIQWITRGDAYVEFTAGETTRSHVAGLSEIPAGCAFPCTDLNATLSDIAFGIRLNAGGGVRLVENGATFGAFDTYSAGERYRVIVTDNNNGANTATITYSRVLKSCVGAACPDSVFHTAVGAAHYPLRVDTSLFEPGATLTGVRLVRIQ